MKKKSKYQLNYIINFFINRLLLETYIWEKNTSSLVQFSEQDFFLKNSFIVQESIKLFKDLTFNRTVIENIDEENSKINNENYKLLGSITKEKEKFYFVPLLIDLGNDKENVNDVPWLIYNNKVEPEINHSYILKEGDILKMGNAIFRIKMIQINENDNKLNGNNNDTENLNNTLLISGSANHSLVLNKYDEINITSKKISIKRNPSLPSEKSGKRNGNGQIMTGQEKNEKKSEEKQKQPKNKNKNRICRICYQEEDDDLLNPLIRPCKCSGSMKYIHLKCLLHWLKSRTSNNSIMNNSNENFNAYYINQKTECELCKQLFPDYIKHNDIKYCLIDFDYAQENKIKENNNMNNNNQNQNYVNTNMENNNNPNNKNIDEKNNFIVLDTVFPLTDNNRYRYIVKLDNNNEMKIGRGLDNQLILNEITVSRNHCLLNLQKNKFGNYELKMEDQSSKFGSLVLLQLNKIEIIKGKPLQIQISNVHLKIQYKRNNSLLSCCNVEEVDDKNSYEKMNNKAVKSKNIVKILTEDISEDGVDNNNEKNSKNSKSNEGLIDENKSNDSKEIKVNKKNEILLINKSNLDSNINENMKTVPKDISDKKDNKENENNNKDKYKDDNNKEVINDSIEVDEDNNNK